jgi:Mg-chelatase subunit ChlD
MNTKMYGAIILILILALAMTSRQKIPENTGPANDVSSQPSSATAKDGTPYRLSCGDFLKMELEIDDSDSSDKAMKVKVKAFLKANAENFKTNREIPLLPLNISFVLDTSGSMEADSKMVKVKDATMQIATKLNTSDYLSIITYATDAQLVLESSNNNSRDHLKKVIEEIQPVGATNISEGLKMALVQINKQKSNKNQSHIILLSDGKANFGIKDPDKLVQLTEELAFQRISISTVGIGDDYNTDLLKDMAKAGNGRFYAVKDAGNIFDTFTEDLESLKNNIIKNIRLTVKSADKVAVQGFAQTGNLLCKTSFLDSSPTFQIAGLSKTDEAEFLLSFNCPSNASKPQDLATFTGTYTISRDGKEIQEEISLTPHYRPNGKTIRERWLSGPEK